MKKNNQLKLSIIIPSYNQGMFLEETILSVINQDCDDVEIIVMDGGSTDNSVEIIKKYESYISYWQSKKDNGQSDAINQGFMRASGEYVTWLNSDDVLLPNALSHIFECIRCNPSTNWFLGNVLWLNKNGHVIRVGKVEKENKFWNRHYFFSNGGPSAIMRKSRLIELGLLREDFHYTMDTELWHRYLSQKDYFVRIPVYCWGLRVHELSKTTGCYFLDSQQVDPTAIQKEKERKILENLYPKNEFFVKLWQFLKIFRLSFYTRYCDKKILSLHYKELSI